MVKMVGLPFRRMKLTQLNDDLVVFELQHVVKIQSSCFLLLDPF